MTDRTISPSLRAAVDRVIPAGRRAGGWAGGVGRYLETAGAELDWARPLLVALADRLDGLAGGDFAGLDTERQDALLAALEHDPEAEREFAALRRLCWEGFYAASPDNPEPVGLELVGFRAVPPGVTPVEPDLVPDAGPSGVTRAYDAIVVGSGPGGGVAAQVLTAAGRTVLVVERAPRLPNAALRGDHLHGKRAAVYGVTVGPGPGHPRVAQLPEGDRLLDGTDDSWLYGLNAFAMGGGTRIWQGMAWRFLPEDFRMRSEYGNPDGASLADWPVDYDAMEPYYSRAERELGVAGEEGGLTGRTPRSAPYPMPAFGTERAREVLAAAAEGLGWGWGPIPLALNSVPHDGRPACVRCPQCVGHACPVNAKNGSHNTFLPRAVATGRCTVLYDAEVLEVRDGVDRAGVTLVAGASAGAPVELEVTADVVVVAAGAVETARLLLASGLGNDQVGRHLHDHRFVTMLSRMDEPVKPYVGPGHSVATLDHVHGDTIPWGGGVLVDLMSLLPLTHATAPPPGVPGWGAGHRDWMSGDRAKQFGVFGMGQEIPMPTSRVTLADARDRWGRPGAALRKLVHRTSVEVEDGMAAQGERWLLAAGAHDVRRQRAGATASAAGEHSCGTARMAASPAAGATDPFGRLWGSRRVVVCDSSLHPTNGSVNPTLTIVANAYRVAEALAAEWVR
ncbi:GMC oxidoreductase [Amnibacterium sp. CER49]|uniref:GMC oxidoreductase n=1 Tax=Amnibacterium sp. CER49 TaxID=3039161 RepID=UPI00244820C1|nr:GMC oxidoreductase [Amnibacterium sp. CER49]MDH2444797.1 GMC oxidoreductase [Amnibacterium sp. CER49]